MIIMTYRPDAIFIMLQTHIPITIRRRDSRVTYNTHHRSSNVSNVKKRVRACGTMARAYTHNNIQRETTLAAVVLFTRPLHISREFLLSYTYYYYIDVYYTYNSRNVTYIARDVHTWRSFCTYLFIYFFFQLAAGHPTLQSADTAAAPVAGYTARAVQMSKRPLLHRRRPMAWGQLARRWRRRTTTTTTTTKAK